MVLPMPSSQGLEKTLYQTAPIAKNTTAATMIATWLIDFMRTMLPAALSWTDALGGDLRCAVCIVTVALASALYER
jgi:hypothetical protein